MCVCCRYIYSVCLFCKSARGVTGLGASAARFFFLSSPSRRFCHCAPTRWYGVIEQTGERGGREREKDWR